MTPISWFELLQSYVENCTGRYECREERRIIGNYRNYHKGVREKHVTLLFTSVVIGPNVQTCDCSYPFPPPAFLLMLAILIICEFMMSPYAPNYLWHFSSGMWGYFNNLQICKQSNPRTIRIHFLGLLLEGGGGGKNCHSYQVPGRVWIAHSNWDNWGQFNKRTVYDNMVKQ